MSKKRFKFKKARRLWKTLNLYIYFTKETGFYTVPHPSMRYRVHGTYDLLSFLQVGRRCKDDIIAALKKIDRNLDSFRNILDFGCGCGRTLTWLAKYAKSSQLHGTDIDTDAISWCKKNIKFITCDVNSALPPLRYPSESFDLVYAISVFSHIKEDYQFRWLDELKRIIKPGGILLVSLQGRNIWGQFSPDYVERIEKEGFVFRQSGFWKTMFPEWYEDAFHAEKYVRDEFSKYFSVLDYIPKGINDHQDMVILQKRTA